MRIHILGLKTKQERHYGLTTWSGDVPIYYAIYDINPGYWDEAHKVTPVAIAENEEDLLRQGFKCWWWIGFGWSVQ